MKMRPPLAGVSAIFLGYFFLQLLSAALLFGWKQGFAPSSVYEYYQGSEAMLKRYPDATDRFLQARSLEGILKAGLAHFAVYGLSAFTLVHLLRSSLGHPGRLVERIVHSYFLICLLELLAPFLTRIAVAPGEFRLLSLGLYLFSSAALAAWLLRQVLWSTSDR